MIHRSLVSALLLTLASPAFAWEDCTNGVDDDGDGYSDCDDFGCDHDARCIAEDCTNAFDDDGDGYADCADDECTGHASCGGDADTDTDTDADADSDADADTDAEEPAPIGCTTTGVHGWATLWGFGLLAMARRRR